VAIDFVSDIDATEGCLAAVKLPELLWSENDDFAVKKLCWLLASEAEPDLEVSAFALLAPMARSNGLPGDFGVFAEPKDAKAPEPRAKAFDAAPVGEARPPPGVVTELKGLDFPWEEVSPPNRFEKEALRLFVLSPWLAEPPLLGVDKESLLELREEA
jgi:hypothetical protein